MGLTNKQKVEVLKEAKRLFKEAELKAAYNSYTFVEGLCYCLDQASLNLGFRHTDVSFSGLRRMEYYKPIGKSWGEYWWPRTLEYVPTRRRVLDELIEYYSLPWYKRLLIRLKIKS